MSDDNSTEDISVETAMDLYQEALAEAAAIAGEQSASEKSTALVVSTESPELVKQRLIDSRVAIASAQKKVRETKERLEVTIKAQRAEMDKKLEEMSAFLEPLQKQMHRIADGIDAMNLYMGRDEFIHTIREGVKAPKDSPIVIRQRVLAMDEETAIDAIKGGIDAMDIDKFDAWLLADPKNVQQVIPEEKAVVALRVRATAKDYNDPWQAIAMKDANKETWWLIRNGENLYRMVTEFEVGTNLVPQSDEFTKLFVTGERFGRANEAIKPGTDEWLRAEQRADAKTRHYMKIALILQGLVDRTEVFRPLAVEGLSVIDHHYYDEGYVRVITDAELAIDSNMKPFRDWLNEKNSKVTVGTRIILAKVYRNNNDSFRINPQYASAPLVHVPYVVKEQGLSSTWYIKYPRTDTIWGTGRYDVEHVAKTSASYYFYAGDSDHIAIDHVTVDEMQAYLEARSQRHNYTDMFPVLQAAIEFKRAEVEQEAPFRALLAAELEKAGYPDSVDDLIFWWKTAHKWNRPLIGDQDLEAKAARVTVAEAKRRNAGTDDEAIVEKFRAAYPDAMAVLRGTANYVVLIPEVYAVAPYRSSHNVFVRRIDLTKTGIVKDDKRWTVISKAQSARLTPLYSTPQWEGWNIGAKADSFLAEPDYTPLLDTAREYIVNRSGKNAAVVTVTDFGTGWNSDYASINITVEHEDIDIDSPIRLSDGNPKLKSKIYSLHINKKDGVSHLDGSRSEAYYVSVSDGWWRAKHNNFINPTHDSGDLESPWDDSKERNAIVWMDDKIVAQERDFADRYKKRSIEFAFLDKKADRLLNGIKEAWFDEYEKKLYARFLEDFGDDGSMWEEHRNGKRKSAQFPYPDAIEKYGHNRSRINDEATLRWLVVRLMETGNAPYGLTVAEAYKGAQLLLTNVSKVELPDDIRDLRFLPEESNEVVKAS